MSTYRELNLEEAYLLWKAGVYVEGRYTDKDTGELHEWESRGSDWRDMDWDFLRREPEWRDEFRVEVE